MTVTKPETALFRAPTFSSLLASHGGLVHVNFLDLIPVCTSISMYIEVISILSALRTRFHQTGSKSIVSESIRLIYGRYIQVVN